MVHEVTTANSGDIVVVGKDASTLSSLTQRFGHTINIKDDYGAVGDGVTDDTSAIQAAIEANKGLTIFFPTGVYLVTDTLDMVGDGTAAGSFGCSFLGDGYLDPNLHNNVGGTEFLWDGGAKPFIDISSNRLSFENFRFDGQSTCTRVFKTRWVSGAGVHTLRFKDMHVLDTDYFFFTDSGTDPLQSDCMFDNVTHKGGISFLKINNTFGLNYYIERCAAQTMSGPALHFVKGGGVVADQLSLKDVEWALQVDTASGDGGSQVFVFNGLYYDSSSSFQGCVNARSGSIQINGLITNNSARTAGKPFFDLSLSKARLTVINGQTAQTHSASFPILKISGVTV